MKIIMDISTSVVRLERSSKKGFITATFKITVNGKSCVFEASCCPSSSQGVRLDVTRTSINNILRELGLNTSLAELQDCFKNVVNYRVFNHLGSDIAVVRLAIKNILGEAEMIILNGGYSEIIRDN